MTLQETKKLSQHIFRLLKVDEIVIPIGRTNRGNLGIRFSTQSEDFEIYLDAVPLTTKDMLKDDNNIELKKMLEKYLFEEETESFTYEPGFTINEVIAKDAPKSKKRGRPAKKE